MPRIPPRSVREVCKILEEHGFREIRQTGSHIQMQARIETERGWTTVTVPVPNHSEIPVGTIRRIIRLSQVPRENFE
ncbi:MAG: type II toxin-antitoxin system HicA family toxin [Caldilineaceae bacterium SB0668_bin_21]|nr:type II toxin-antitoxin system HicA family toxin [Caldilineaceae bacterium SB0668_bin_21]MYC20951.1 type II toxin-antitoxin system HicA family toxin [Caldilineaceae bacterium SB0662_bin_25]